jgi:tetratricopeptide (TPR) repeat protein
MSKKLLLSTSLFCSLSTAAFALSVNTPVSSAWTDPSQKYFNQAVEAVGIGDKATLRKLYDYDVLDGITNHDSISRTLNDLLKRIHQEAKGLYKKGEVAKAAERLELAFDFTAYVAEKLNRNSNTPDRTPEYWIYGWQQPPLQMAPDVYIPALNDYGFYLQKIDQDAEAVRVLQAVISIEPEREITYLNLAEALWKLGRKEEALPYLEKYKEIREAESKEASIVHMPTEAVLHVSSSIRPQTNSKKSSPKAQAELAPYIISIQKEIKAHWHPPKAFQTESTVLQFDVSKSGRVSNVVVAKSTNQAYKEASLKALKGSSLPPMPAEAPDSIPVEFTFSYNVPHKLDKEDLVVKQWLAKLAQNHSAENHAGLAEAYDDDGNYVKAREQLLLALAKAKPAQTKKYEELLRDIDVQLAEVRKEISDLGKESPKANPRLAVPQAALNNQGVNGLNSADYGLAIQKLSQALNIEPGYNLARNNLGIVFNNRGITERSNKVKALLDFHRAQLLRTDHTASEKNIATSIKSIIKGHDSYELRKDLADGLAARHDDVGAIVEYRRALLIKDDAKIREPLHEQLDRIMSPSYSDGQFITDPR